MNNYPVIEKASLLFLNIEYEFNQAVKVGMSKDEVLVAVESIENFSMIELQHVVNNVFTWGKPLSESSKITIRNEYFNVLKREIIRTVKNEWLLEDYSQ